MSGNLIVVIGPITTANRLWKRLDKDYGISARIFHTPVALGSKGCSYSLKTHFKNLPLITEAANRYNIKISGLYLSEKTEGEEVYHALS